ncbi:MAG: hypothetical protein V3T86_09225 [Planctomycetota bacterium]
MENHALRSLIPVGIALFTVLGVVTTVPDLSSGRPGVALDLETLEPHAQPRSEVAHLLEDPLLKPMAAFAKRVASWNIRRKSVYADETRAAMADELGEALEHADFVGEPVSLIVIPAQASHSTEDREKRVRLRYAAMSALRSTGCVPVAKSHLLWTTFPLMHTGEPTEEGLAVYELFKPSRESATSNTWVIVVWLADHQIRVNEFEAYKEVVSAVRQGVDRAFNKAVRKGVGSAVLKAVANTVRMYVGGTPGETLEVSVLGPTSSDALFDLNRNWKSADALNWRVISPWATAEAKYFDPAVPTPPRHALLKRRLEPVIGDDGQLVRLLAEELECRRALCRGDHILIVCEWDTLYGRGLAERFRDEAGRRGVKVDVAFYTKQVEPAADPLQGPEPQKPGAKRSNPRAEIEISVGDSQVDYMRRLTRRVRAKNLDYAAVGIFGTDTFDKLVILRALRKLQANAVFFTTDLDDRFMHPRQLPYTRNLVVASHYGLELHPNLQGETMPFRGCYQTAAYLGLLSVFRPELTGRISSLKPQIFEISRSGAYNLSAGGHQTEEDIRPASPATERLELLARIWPVILFGGVFFLVIALLVYGMFNPPSTERRWTVPVIVLIWLAVVFLYAVFFSSQSRDGEPFEWFSGISAWPAVLLRIVVTGYAVDYLMNAVRETSKLKLRQTWDYQLPDAAPPARPRGLALLRPSIIWNLCRTVPIQSWRDRTGDTARLCREYFRLESPGVRILRVCCGVVPVLLIMIAIHYLPRTSILAWPRSPVRGAGAFFLSSLTLWPSLIVMLTVTVFALDAAAIEGRFMRLMDIDSLSWNAGLLRDEADRRGIPERAVTLILWVELLRDRSRVVSRFLYAPFIVFALMILIHNHAFDDFRTPAALVLAFLAGLGLIVWAGLAMRGVAIQTKARIIQKLQGILQEIRREGGFRVDRADSMKASIDELDAIDVGAFGNLRSHPIFGAIALPLGGIGTIQLLNMLG